MTGSDALSVQMSSTTSNPTATTSPTTAEPASEEEECYFRPQLPKLDDEDELLFKERTPIQPTAEVEAEWDLTQQRLWIGFCAFVVVLFLSLLLAGERPPPPTVIVTPTAATH